jgi:hypothetical protein
MKYLRILNKYIENRDDCLRISHHIPELQELPLTSIAILWHDYSNNYNGGKWIICNPETIEEFRQIYLESV